MKSEKLFAGAKVRRLRQARSLNLEACARALGVSPSYLSQIETNRRPVSSRVLVDLIALFGVEPSTFDLDDGRRLVADLREASLDMDAEASAAPLGEIRQAVVAAPALARQFLALHRAYRRLEQRMVVLDEALGFDEAVARSALTPWEVVRDYFHYRNNYIDSIDGAAEDLAAAVGIGSGESPERLLEAALAARFGVSVDRDERGAGVLRAFDAPGLRVRIDATQPEASRAFQLAYQLAMLSFGPLIEAELAQSGLPAGTAREIGRIGLTNYAAGALLLPYGAFRAAAREMRHDLERLRLRFGASFEQICHRLSNLQRPGQAGTPFYFVRLDMAGNITKRHSATRLQFARFGGACPLWNVHEAFARPEEILVQIAETPDGVRHLCVAIGVVKRGGAYDQPVRRYALGLGCEIHNAGDLVYSDGLDLAARPARIGISCRICERGACTQRAFPPLDKALIAPADLREIVPYRLVERA